MRAALWLFSYRGAEDETWLSIIRELQAWGRDLSFRVCGGEAMIDRARSKVASLFLQEGSEEVLLMVDSDMAWQTGGMAAIAERALSHGAVVGAIYPKRAFNQGAALRVTRDTEEDFTIGKDGLVEAEFVGAGFMAIPHSILQAVARGLPSVCEVNSSLKAFWPFFMPHIITSPSGLEYPNEDHAFCHRVREAGFKVYAATMPRITHKGAYAYRMVDSAVSPPPDKDVTVHLERRVAVCP